MEKSSSPSASVADDKSTLFQNPEFQVPPWEPSRICLPVSLCPGDDTTVVDLKQWFVNVDNPNLLSHHMDKRYWLPSTVKASGDNNKTSSDLAEFFNSNTCRANGYKVVVRGTDKRSFGVLYTLKCQCARTNEMSKSDKSNAKSKTTHTHFQPKEDNENCPHFYIPVFLDNNSRRFYLKQHCGVNFQHTNHLPVRSEHMKLGQSAIPEDLRQIAEEMLGKHCPSSVVKLLINVVSGESITSKAVHNLRGAVMLRKFSDSTKNSEDTTAQQLLNYVKNKPGMSYAYMTASFNAALGLVRVSKVVGKKYEKKAQYQPLPGLSSDQNIFEEQCSDEECKDNETVSYVRALMKCLQLGDDEILLALVHCFKLSQRMHGVEIVQEASRQRLFCLRISDAELKEEHMLHRRPLYARTRRVQAVEKVIQGHTVVVLICSCGRFKRMVCACCEHVLALLQREPTKDDVFPRSLKMYELKYAEDFEFTKRCDARTAFMLEAGGVIVRDIALDDLDLPSG